jgi:hypothetical protein
MAVSYVLVSAGYWSWLATGSRCGTSRSAGWAGHGAPGAEPAWTGGRRRPGGDHVEGHVSRRFRRRSGCRSSNGYRGGYRNGYDMSTALETSGLGKRFGRSWGLRDCSLAVPAGRIAGLVGPNGASGRNMQCQVTSWLRSISARSLVLASRCRTAAFNASSSSSSCAEPKCSMFREPRREKYRGSSLYPGRWSKAGSVADAFGCGARCGSTSTFP